MAGDKVLLKEGKEIASRRRVEIEGTEIVSVPLTVGGVENIKVPWSIPGEIDHWVLLMDNTLIAKDANKKTLFSIETLGFVDTEENL